MTTAEDMKGEARRTWGRLAPAWDRHRSSLARSTGHLARFLVDAAELDPGDTVLEVGAGPGDVGLLAADAVGPEGRLISTDLAPEMVEVARRTAETEGVTNATFEVMDAEALDLADDSVDAVVSRFVYMMCPDPRKAFSEARRVLENGGRFVFTVWGPAERNPWVVVPALTLVMRGLMPMTDPAAAGGLFSLADPGACRSLLTEAGFDEVEASEISTPFLFDDFEQMWDVQMDVSGPIALTIAELDDDTVEEIKDEIRSHFEPYRTGEGYELPGLAIAYVAR